MVTVEPEDYELLKRVAAAQGASMGSILREYVEMSRPMLQHVAALFDQLQAADSERRLVHEQALESAMDKGQAVIDSMNGQLSLLWDVLQSATQDIEGSGCTVSEVAQGPPTCNTGVRFRKRGSESEGGSGF